MHSWANDLTQLCTVNGLISILTLTLLEIVLGIDNIIFISITADKLPRNLQKRARTIGLVLALVIRCIMLFSISLIAGAVNPLFSIGDSFGVSGRGLILFGGGIFLLVKTTKEIREKLAGHDEGGGPNVKKVSFANIVIQIVLIDIIFSFDSILTAVGLSGNILIMVSAVIISMILMMLFSSAVSDFINRNPTIKMLALGFLIVIGGLLTSEAVVDGINLGNKAKEKSVSAAIVNPELKEGVLAMPEDELLRLLNEMPVKPETEKVVNDYMVIMKKDREASVDDLTSVRLEHMKEIHLNKNYVYFALAFCLFIEGLNMRERKKKKERNFGD